MSGPLRKRSGGIPKTISRTDALRLMRQAEMERDQTKRAAEEKIQKMARDHNREVMVLQGRLLRFKMDLANAKDGLIYLRNAYREATRGELIPGTRTWTFRWPFVHRKRRERQGDVLLRAAGFLEEVEKARLRDQEDSGRGKGRTNEADEA